MSSIYDILFKCLAPETDSINEVNVEEQGYFGDRYERASPESATGRVDMTYVPTGYTYRAPDQDMVSVKEHQHVLRQGTEGQMVLEEDQKTQKSGFTGMTGRWAQSAVQEEEKEEKEEKEEIAAPPAPEEVKEDDVVVEESPKTEEVDSAMVEETPEEEKADVKSPAGFHPDPLADLASPARSNKAKSVKSEKSFAFDVLSSDEEY